MTTLRPFILIAAILLMACTGQPTRNLLPITATFAPSQQKSASLPDGSYNSVPVVTEPIIVKPPAVTQSVNVSPKLVIAKDYEKTPAVPIKYIWSRLDKGLALDTHQKNPSVQSQIKRYLSQTDFFNATSDRAAPFIFLIMEELDNRNLPYDLALLPMVESEFHTNATSPKGAAGIWQFAPKTGKAFGLHETSWYDGRMDVQASTFAALDYLQSLNQQFDGDWLLTLAAYNAGPGRVQEAQKANLKKGLPTDYWSLALPLETRLYVPKLLAISSIMRSPQKYGVTLSPVIDEPYLSSIKLNRQIELGLASQLAELDLQTLKQLNPCYKRGATAPDGPHQLLLPIDAAERLQVALVKSPRHSARWQNHRIRPGETLLRIAQKYNISVNILKQKNNLTSNMIHAGSYLIVPAIAMNNQSRPVVISSNS